MTQPSITLPEKTLAFIDQMTTLANDILASLNETKVTDDDSYAALTENLKTVKRIMNDLEGERTSITKPMNDELRAINARFAEPMSRLQFIEKQMKFMAANYAVEKRAEQQRLPPLRERHAREQKQEAYTQAVEQAAKTTAPTVAGVSFTERWEWSVTDLSKIPREYLRVDEAKINGAVKSGLRDIPGVHIFPVTQTRVVAGK